MAGDAGAGAGHKKADRRAAAIRRARSLVALSRDRAGTPEGETAAQLAIRIIARWDLTEAELGDWRVGRARGDESPQDASEPLWLRTLLLVIAESHGCDASGLEVIGPPHLVQRILHEFTSMRDLIDRSYQTWNTEQRRKSMVKPSAPLRLLYEHPAMSRDDKKLVKESYGVTAALALKRRLTAEARELAIVDEIVAGTLAEAQDAVRAATALKPTRVEEREKTSRVGRLRFARIGHAEYMVERMVWPPERPG